MSKWTSNKTFNGVRYVGISDPDSKLRAVRLAKSYRSAGYLVRVVKVSKMPPHVYVVYVKRR